MAAPARGLDADLLAKQEAKYDHELEKRVLDWIQEITSDQLVDGMTFAEWLNDGRILCQLMNSIQPGTIAKINTMRAPFKKMENITKWTDAARKIGVPESAMFATPDLYEEKNMGSVVNCIYTFACVVQTAIPEFTGPKLGTAMAASTEPIRERKAATQTGGLAGNIDKTQNHGGREIAALGPSGAQVASGAQVGEADVQGLDADMKKKMEGKFDPEIDRQVCTWIEAVTGQAKAGTSAEWLKDGQVLCSLANAIKPGSVEGVSNAKAAYNQMENIKKFLAMARGLGMPESSLFSTPDLFEEKNMSIVVTALFTFGGWVQTHVSDFTGPALGVAINSEVKDQSRGIGLITDQYQVFQETMVVDTPEELRRGGIATRQ